MIIQSSYLLIGGQAINQTAKNPAIVISRWLVVAITTIANNNAMYLKIPFISAIPRPKTQSMPVEQVRCSW